MIIHLLLEIQEQVFAYCSIEDLQNLAVTNTSYNKALKSHLFKTIFIQWDSLLTDDILSDSRIAFLEYSKFICIDDMRHLIKSSRDLREEKQSIICENVNWILRKSAPRGLEFKNFHLPDNIFQLAGKQSNLQKLGLFGCENITNQNLDVLFKNVKDLEFLSIEMCTFRDADLEKVARLSKLRELSLSKCLRLTDGSLSFVASLTLLTKLDISFNTQLTDEGISLLQTLINIHELDISACSLLTDKSLRYISSAMTSIRILNANRCTNITDTGMFYVSNAKKIERLSVLSTYRTSKLGMFYLKKLAGTLRCLRVPGWGGVSQKGVPRQYLGYLACLENLEELVMGPSFSTDVHDLQALSSLKQLKKLDLSYMSSLSPGGLSHITALPHLEDLSLVYCVNSNHALQQISSIKSLRKLYIGSLWGGEDYDISILKVLPKLEVLKLNRWQINQTNIASIGQIITLKSISFNQSRLGITPDVDFSALCNLVHLEDIDVCGNRNLTDENIKQLCGLKSIKRLNIGSCTNITDRCLVHLHTLPFLRVVGVTFGNCGISKEGLRSLHNVNIIHSEHF